MPYLSASAVVIHYEEALYEVYASLPLPLPFALCYFVICVFCLLVVIVRLSIPVQVTSLERLVSEMTCNMLTGTLSPTQSLVHFQMFINDNILRCSDVLCTVARRLNIHTSTWSSSTTSVSPVTVTSVRTSSRSATIPAWLSPALGQQSH